MRCQREISRTTGDRKFPLADRFGGIAQSLADVFRLEVGISLQYLGLRHPLAHHPNDSGHGNTQSPDTGQASHLVWVYRDSLECFHFNLQLGWSLHQEALTNHHPKIARFGWVGTRWFLMPPLCVVSQINSDQKGV